eukprot:scaffold10685_cov77-Cylindrotheca_fusiformis.AAC.1
MGYIALWLPVPAVAIGASKINGSFIWKMQCSTSMFEFGFQGSTGEDELFDNSSTVSILVARYVSLSMAPYFLRFVTLQSIRYLNEDRIARLPMCSMKESMSENRPIT